MLVTNWVSTIGCGGVDEGTGQGEGKFIFVA
jgi:hypothetical protein